MEILPRSDDEARREAGIFLKTLYGSYTDGFIEVRWFAPEGQVGRGRRFFPIANLANNTESENFDSNLSVKGEFLSDIVRFAFALSKKKQNVYVGVLPRRTKDNGKAENVSQGNFLWADAEPHKRGYDAVYRAMVKSQPYLVVWSGHGFHAYWKLSSVIDFEEPTKLKRQKFSASLHKMQVEGSGIPSDAVHDVSRILRIPGTMNWKSEDINPETGEKRNPDFCPEPVKLLYVENKVRSLEWDAVVSEVALMESEDG